MQKVDFVTLDGFDAVILSNGHHLSGYIEAETDGLDIAKIEVLGGVTLLEEKKIGLDFAHDCVSKKLSFGLMKSQLNVLSSYL